MIEDVNNFNILTSEEEKNQRMSLCNACEKNQLINNSLTCDACACPIEYVITYKFKNCPLSKWEL